MKKELILSLLLISSQVFSQSGADTLLKENSLNTTSEKISAKKMLDLSDTFLVSTYGRLKSLNIRNEKLKSYFESFFDKNYEKALTQYPGNLKVSAQEARLLRSSKMYLLWKLHFPQSFFNAWVNEASQHDFLNTELGVALDQIISKDASSFLFNNGIVTTQTQKTQIIDLTSKDSLFNRSLQAYVKLRTGEKGFVALKNLVEGDFFALPLAKSIITDFAIQGKLAEAGNIIKQIIEPAILKSSDVELISDYYIMLGRLLYQAKAYKQAKEYYYRVPDESSKFLTARVEALWISTLSDDFSTTLGELPSLQIFEKEFLPERYLVMAMAQLKLCQFKNVHDSINKYISSNKIYSKLIEKNLTSKNPESFTQKNDYLTLWKNAKKSLSQEILKAKDSLSLDTLELSSQLKLAEDEYQKEIYQEWKNKKRLIELSLRKMRFVKIEFLSTMRRLSHKIFPNENNTKDTDNISTLTSAVDKTDKLEFPYEGVLFGDELFHMYSKISSLCLQEKL